MIALTSKIQYKNFEVGEFIEENQRTYEETIALIENFPWNKERENIVIDLTNPSVTIEGKNNDFLKLALFFNSKYVLHYFSDELVLYNKSFVELKDAYFYIKNYFDSSTFDKTDFRKENTWLQHNLKHFVSQNFRYELTPESQRKFLTSTSGMNFLLSTFLMFMPLFLGRNHLGIGVIFVFLLIIFFAGGGINLLLFFNYRSYAKDKVLIMSKGNDIFYYGDKVLPKKYDKHQIYQVTVIKNSGYKSPIVGFAITKIELDEGTEIRIPSLMVDYIAMKQKLYSCTITEENGFPYIRN